MQRAAIVKVAESLAFGLFSLGVAGIAIVVAVGMVTDPGHSGTDWLTNWAAVSLAIAILGSVTGSIAQAAAPASVRTRRPQGPSIIDIPVPAPATATPARHLSAAPRPAVSAFRALPAADRPRTAR